MSISRHAAALVAASLLMAALAPACAPAGSSDLELILAAARKERGAWRKLEWLSDRIGPRLSGGPGLEAAIRWTAQEMERDGLERVRAEPVRVPHWERGAEAAWITAPVLRPMAVTALGGSEPTPEGGIEAEVIEVRSFEELDAAGDRVKGRIVLYAHEMRRNGRGERGYGHASGLRTCGAVEGARRGAVAALVRSLGTASYRLPHTGMMHNMDGVTRIPAAAIAAEDAERLHRLLQSGEAVRARLTLGCRWLPDADSANVVGELRGRESPDEIVLLGAHLDSWDLGDGAIDDGAGVAIVMDAARILASLDQRPRRTIRVVLFTNEENGLRGGKTYAESHAVELSRHVAAIESDGGAGRPRGFGVTAGAGGLAFVERLALPLADLRAHAVRDGGGGADIGPLRAAGVPLLGLDQDGTHYFDWHHTSADTLDKVDPEDLARNTAAMAWMAWRLAEIERPLPRAEPEPVSVAPVCPPRRRR